MATFNTINHAFAREQLAVTTGAVVALTAATYNAIPVGASTPGNQMPFGQRRATSARVSINSGGVMFTEEGTTPTTTLAGVGTVASALDLILLHSYEAICKFKCIAHTGATVLEVVYFR